VATTAPPRRRAEIPDERTPEPERAQLGWRVGLAWGAGLALSAAVWTGLAYGVLQLL